MQFPAVSSMSIPPAPFWLIYGIKYWMSEVNQKWFELSPSPVSLSFPAKPTGHQYNTTQFSAFALTSNPLPFPQMAFPCGRYQSHPQGSIWKTAAWLLCALPSPRQPSGKGVCHTMERWEIKIVVVLRHTIGVLLMCKKKYFFPRDVISSFHQQRSARCFVST